MTSDHPLGLLHCIGLSHRTAPATLREQVAFADDSLAHVLADARRSGRIGQLAIVSTCHRTELYAEFPRTGRHAAATDDSVGPADRLLGWLAESRGVAVETLTPHTYALSGDAAARHLMRVATGLDSVMLGEPQIIAQIAGAMRQSVAAHAASPALKAVFRSAVRAGERARGTVWGRMRASNLGIAAVAAAARLQDGLAGAHVAILGAGEIAQLALSELAEHEAVRITIVNRTTEHADALAARHHAAVAPLDEFERVLATADVVIAATGAEHTLIDAAMITRALGGTTRRITLVDVSLPRNVHPEVRDVAGAHLVDIDALGAYVATLDAEHAAAIPRVEEIVSEELAALWHAIAAHARPAERATLSQSA